MSGRELVEAGVCDVVKLFIKTEPHKRDKLDTGRYRLISNVSVVDQLIERLLNAPLNRCEIDNWQDIPSKPGIGFDVRSQLNVKLWLSKRADCGHKVYESDVSGFDWSVHGEWLLWDAYYRGQAYLSESAEALAFVRSALQLRAHCICAKVFLCSDGMLVDLPSCYGVQASGSYNTSSTNSRVRVAMRCLLDIMAGDTLAWCVPQFLKPARCEIVPFSVGRYCPVIAMGDDALESDGLCFYAHTNPYDQLGIKTTVTGRPVLQDTEFEFCSYIWCARRGVSAYPVNWAKSLMRLTGGPRDDLELRCSAVLNEFDPCPGGVRARSEAILRKLGWYGGRVPTGLQECEAS